MFFAGFYQFLDGLSSDFGMFCWVLEWFLVVS